MPRRFKGKAKDDLLKADIALHASGFIDNEGTRFDSGLLGKALQQHIEVNPEAAAARYIFLLFFWWFDFKYLINLNLSNIIYII